MKKKRANEKEKTKKKARGKAKKKINPGKIEFDWGKTHSICKRTM